MKLKNIYLIIVLVLIPFVLKSQSLSSIELIDNGDFENGLTGFSTEYSQFVADETERGSYMICINPRFDYYRYQDQFDHTTGHTNMLFFDCDTLPGKCLISKKIINVTPNTNYMFSMWVRANNLYTREKWYPKLDFLFNGDSLLKRFDVNDTTQWNKVEIIWNSGTNTSLEIKMYNEELAKNPYGFKSGVSNDFAIDDLSLRKICDSGVEMPDSFKICTGDTTTFEVKITGAGLFEKFEWLADNEINAIDPFNPVFFPTTSKYYYLDVVGKGGCDFRDSVYFEVHKTPNPRMTLNTNPVICPCKDLFITVSGGDDSYPFNYVWNDGFIGTNREITMPGYYSITISNALNCSRTIDTTITGISSNISASIDTFKISSGDTLTIPLNFSVNEGISKCGYNNFRVKLSYNKSLLVPITSGLTTTELDGKETIEYSGPVTSDLNNYFKFIATLGDSVCTDISIDEFDLSCDEINLDLKNGRLCLDNVCSQPNDRLFSLSNDLILKQNIPNPAYGNTQIEFSLSSPGYTELTIYDALGNVIATPVAQELQNGDYKVQINTANYNAGVYVYVLKNGYDSFSKIMHVVK